MVRSNFGLNGRATDDGSPGISKCPQAQWFPAPERAGCGDSAISGPTWVVENDERQSGRQVCVIVVCGFHFENAVVLFHDLFQYENDRQKEERGMAIT